MVIKMRKINSISKTNKLKQHKNLKIFCNIILNLWKLFHNIKPFNRFNKRIILNSHYSKN
jgi:hypothetical protein